MGVIVIAATNRPDVLDPALLRPGRFDRQVVVPLPDIRGREEILKVHMRKVPLAPDVNPNIIARGTPGMSGASPVPKKCDDRRECHGEQANKAVVRRYLEGIFSGNVDILQVPASEARDSGSTSVHELRGTNGVDGKSSSSRRRANSAW